MSLPSTGKVTVNVAGDTCFFDGQKWSGPPDLVATLDRILSTVPTHHYPIVVVAQRCLELSGLSGRITSVQQDAWSESEELPADAVD